MTVEASPSYVASPPAETPATLTPRDVIRRGLARRYAAERRFKIYGIAAIVFAIAFLIVLFTSIISRGYSSFVQSAFHVSVFLDPKVVDPASKREQDALLMADYRTLAVDALAKALDVDQGNQRDERAVAALLSHGVDVQIRQFVLDDPTMIGKQVDLWLLASDNVDALIKGSFDRSIAESLRKLSNQQFAWVDKAYASGLLRLRFNTGFFTYGASSQPETAGIGVALIGTVFMMLTVVVLALPLGVAAAAYLQEFAPKNRLTDIIEVNINNLAAVPSIVFGILGLAIFINMAGLPRSASILGGLVLTLMTLPTIIIATRAAIGAVPPSIREASIGVGASDMQTLLHHVLPLAFPGILTGTIIGLAKALGETAPLLMIGMVAFVVEYPRTPLDPATALPVQIYMWATAAQRGFVERTSGATLMLLLFLACMNLVAVVLRSRLERRW
jgi:phosphate transport system permease protein